MELTAPPDKSLTHRALILAGLAQGTSRLSGLLAAEDPRSTAGCLRSLGVGVSRLPDDGSPITLEGRGLRGLSAPQAVLNAGNSGTTARLLLGVLAGHPFEATVTGDDSLRSRPMGRVIKPLRDMGARIQGRDGSERLPLTIRGGDLEPVVVESPVASAQVKSAILLAGLVAGVPVTVRQPGRSRDHTERMLSGAGVRVLEGVWRGATDLDEGWEVRLPEPPSALEPLDFRVPGDFSSAAFLVALALLGAVGSELRIRNVGLNPTRTGLLPVLKRMGASVAARLEGEAGGEPVGNLVVEPGPLVGVEVGGEEIPDLVDEVPVLAVLAARARGVTRITGAGELRVKESDRIRALKRGLEAVGVEVEELEDGLEIQGTDRSLQGRVDSSGDHRIAMAFGVLGRAVGGDIEVGDPQLSDVSFPGFWRVLDRLAPRRRGVGP